MKAGEFTAADQRLLQAAFQDRNEGDYAGVFPPREKAEQRLKDAEEFVARVAKSLREKPLGPS